MGLGKTLTTIALLWTLLKQGPNGRPAISKALVVAPSSLTRNWAQEARKWLGDERLRTAVIDSGAAGAQQVLEFRAGAVARVAILSYESLRRHAPALAGCAGVLVADEGHRLKAAAGNKTISALLSLNCPRRVLLTGTPVQNNLSEFFAMCDVVNPDVLGSLAVFNSVFGGPIAKSRERDASPEDAALGAARSEELARRVASFVLRRGAEVNAAHLPPLRLFVVFCRPSPAQLRALSGILGSTSVRRLLGATGADFGDQTLTVLTSLRKVCNHPCLGPEGSGDGVEDGEGGGEEGGGGPGAPTAAPAISDSGKLAALAVMLETIVSTLGERCVVVSQSTAMLDLIASAICAPAGYSTVRIDGSTDVSKRQDLVNAFNSFGVGQIFLLSTTAGGAGLNLTGANRLVLVDSHWNPAMDAQAMARVWRDGQKKPCVVYRLVTTGSLEEKIYQRQRAKGDIASVTVGGGGEGGASGGDAGAAVAAAAGRPGQFSKEELRQLFTLRTDTACDTADVLGAEKFGDVAGSCGDAPLAAAVAAGHVTFAHLEQEHGGKKTAGEDKEEAGEKAAKREDPSGASELEVDDADDWA